jgi:branched-chain amino acid transport system substrate-binding protein
MSSAQAAQCGMNTGKAATGAPIPVGAIATASGAADISSGSKGAKAYFDCVNANGGINGRPIAYTIEDDQTRPDKAAEIAKKLVEDNKSVALVGSSSLVDCITTSQYYEQSGIISLMAAGVAPHCFAAKNVATLNAGPRYGGLGIVKYAVEKLGAKHVVCPQPTVPGADWICDGIEKFAKEKGVGFSRFPVDQQTVDNDSLIQQIVQTGGDAVLYNGSPPTFVPFLAAAERADVGDKIKFLFPMPMFNPDMPKAAGPYWNDKMWVNLEFKPADGPDGKNFVEILTAAGVAPDALAQGGYLAARLFTETLLKLDPAKIDRATVTAALQGVQDFKSDMLCQDWAFGAKDAAARLGNRSGLTAQIHADKWQVNEDCITLSDAEIAN